MEPEEIGKIRIPRNDEVLGIVESMLGANKLKVRCQDNVIRTCRIPGKMRKRIWMREGDVVLVTDKLLGNGQMKHKLTIACEKFSSSASALLKKAGCTVMGVSQLRKENPKGTGIMLIK